jgi:glycyl-tRNA synthetase beta chain
MIVRRVEALGAFLDTEDGASLLTAYRRASNILRIEEKKDDRSHTGYADAKAFTQDEERTLFARIDEVASDVEGALRREDFAAAMAALAKLRGPVDTFFDEVTVNADDLALRDNRLRLLSQIRAAMDRVADFSKIAG